MNETYDAIIVGGGPAGTTTALYALRHGLNILLIDKDAFPRSKTCGDGISRESLRYMQELGLMEKLEATEPLAINGAYGYAPNGNSFFLDIHLPLQRAFLVISPRHTFDNILMEAVKEQARVLENCPVTGLVIEQDQVVGVRCRQDGHETEYRAKVVVGADGYRSIVARSLGLYHHDKRHVSVSLQGYYDGVTELEDAIELHFMREVIPGYLWIFPVGNGRANVGLGLLNRSLQKQGGNLKVLFKSLLENSYLRSRFESARLQGALRGWHLPLASIHRPTYGNGFLLAGDAAGTVDPFSGEGIGNAMRSGEVAGNFLGEICRGNDFNKAALAPYDKRLYERISSEELRFHHTMQRLAHSPVLINWVVGRARNHPRTLAWVSSLIKEEDVARRKAHFRPGRLMRALLS